jgi:MFS family permease
MHTPLPPSPSAASSTLALYGVHVVSWFISFGIFSTFLPGYASTALGASAGEVGLLQAAFFIPSLLFLLVGGVLADRYDKRIFMGVSIMAGAASAALAALLLGRLAPFAVLLAFGFALGTVNAFLNPSRDGMIPHLVPVTAVPRTVAALVGLQFLAQIVGIALAGRVDAVGPHVLLLIQAAVLAVGAVVVPFLPRAVVARDQAPREGLFAIVLTMVTVPFRVSGAMTAAIMSSAAVGVVFIGSFLVLIPELVLKTHGLKTADLSTAIIAFTVGNLVSIFAMIMTKGWSAAPGRFLIGAIVAGAGVLVSLPLAPTFGALLIAMLAWGALAGVVITTGRTLVQLLAGDAMRGRCLAMFQLGFFGGPPIGSLLMGLALTRLAPLTAAMIFATAALVTAAALVFASDLWRNISELKERAA